MRLDPAIQQFLDANAREVLDHLDTSEQRRDMRLLTDLNFLRFSRPAPVVHSTTGHVVGRRRWQDALPRLPAQRRSGVAGPRRAARRRVVARFDRRPHM